MLRLPNVVMLLGIGCLIACASSDTTAPTSELETFVLQPGPHQGKDVWVTSVFSYQDDFGVNDSSLQVGGWGDFYTSLIVIDSLSLLAMPRNATSAKLSLTSYSRGDQSSPVGIDVRSIFGQWDENTGWYSPRPPSQSIRQISAPSAGSIATIDVTSEYNSWIAAPNNRQGLELFPTGNNNQFTVFRSSDFLEVANARPKWEINFSPSVPPLRLKLPLPSGKSWQVSTEIGSRDCQTNDQQLPSHIGANHFSIDFAPVSETGIAESDIRVLAAADGYALQPVASDPNNGNYVVIDHDGDGNPATGYTTRYLHLKRFDPSLKSGPIKQGTPIGTMGNTGTTNVHLHIGVRYNNDGSPSQEPLKYVTMEGLHLVQYMTECQNGNRTRYYPSTNTAR